MKCCASMPCAPSNQNQSCCKNMASPQKPNMLPAKYFSLDTPSAVVKYLRLIEIVHLTPTVPVTVGIEQYSPPDLYTLHSSLLI